MADGRIKWVREQCVSEFDSEGKPLRSQGTVQDVTENRIAELSREASEAQLSSFFEATPDVLLLVDAQGSIVRANQQVMQLLGYTPTELCGQSIEVLVSDRVRAFHPGLRAQFAKMPDARPMALGRSVQARRKDGSEVEVEISLGRVDTEDGVMFACDLRDITERIRQQEAAHQLLMENELILNHALVGIAYLKHRQVVSCNRRFEEIFRYGPGELIGESSERLYDCRETFELIGREAYSVVSEDKSFSTEVRLRYKDGGVFWGTISGKAVDPAHPDDGSIWIYADITELKQAEADLRIAAAAFESHEAMIITDANSVILRVNKAFTDSTGYTAEDIVGHTPSLLKSGRHEAEFYRAMWESLSRTGNWKGEIWDKRKNGEVYPKWLSISAVLGRDGAVSHYIGTHTDITERKKADEKIHDLAFFDQLTGLPNRTLLMDRLKQSRAASSRNDSRGAVLFIDLDDFKTLNDTLGHDMGDMLLKHVAQRLAYCVRVGDTVARLGGDEFVVMLANLSSDQMEAATSIEVVAEKIISSLSAPYQLDGATVLSSASIGIALFSGQMDTIDDLMKQADLAMYKAKEAGRNTFCFFDPAMESAVKERVELERDLRSALEQKQFLLHYQVQVARDGRPTGAEVLLRWRHPQRGLVSPAEFIPLAEQTGLILPLGHWVLVTACTQLANWASQPEMADFSIAVNVSARQLNQSDFVDQVLAVLANTGANPRRLKLELTESLLVNNVQEIIDKMISLKARGVGFSLDDFGTGFSSLSYLKRLPLDQLKIDQSFVSDVLTDANDAAIARTIVALAQSLGLDVIAEGVETIAQQNFLATSGCYAYQGYLFSPPLPIDDFEIFAQNRMCPV
ncbi:MAG: EAL domain-containing protein [Sulfuritalea sp.]|nr:EAL domain-containing protein [Sulfuritalea sp.]